MSKKQQKIILLVDGDAGRSQSQTQALKRLGYEVITFASGQDAVNYLIGDSAVGLVLMDICPANGIDGAEAARQILKERNLPIIFISAQAGLATEKIQGIAHYGYLMKDIGDFALQSAIETAFVLFDAHEKLRLSEEALRNERLMLRTVIDNIPDSIYCKGAAGRKTLANAADVRNMGATSEADVLGKDDFDFFPVEIAQGFFADDQAVIQTGKPVINREEYIPDEQGRKRWLLTSKLPLRDKDEQIIGLVGIGRDITERKLAEEALGFERLVLRTVIDNIPDSIYCKDTACRKTLSNLADVHNMGATSEDDVLGKDDFAFFPKDIAEKFYADDQAVLLTGRPVLNREEYILDAQGRKRWLLTSKLPLRDKDGQIIGLVGIGRDITERKQAEEALQNAQRKK